MNIYYSLILFKIRLIFSNYKFRLIHLNICVHFLELYLREYTNFKCFGQSGSTFLTCTTKSAKLCSECLVINIFQWIWQKYLELFGFFFFFFKVTFVEHVVGVGRCVLVPLHFICWVILSPFKCKADSVSMSWRSL